MNDATPEEVIRTASLEDLFQVSSGECPIKVQLLTPPINQTKCRICWLLPGDTQGPLTPLSTMWGNEHPPTSIRNVLIFCVPKLTPLGKDCICAGCFKKLQIVYAFVRQCLETESQIGCLNGKYKGTVNSFPDDLDNNANLRSLRQNRPDHTYSKISKSLRPAKNPTIKKELDSFWDDPNININAGAYDELSDNDGVADINETPAQTDVKSSPEPLTITQPKGLLDLFDMDSENSRCVVVDKDITEDETDDLVKSGINVIHMSTDPSKKKRVIYIGRDLIDCYRQCPYCSITYFTVAESEDHRLAHKKGKVKLDENVVGMDIFRCRQCPAEFIVQTDFKLHCYYLHQEKKPFACTQCNRNFRNYNDLQDHARFTVDGTRTCQLVCWKCGKDFKKQNLYEEHMLISKASSSCDIIKCKECGESMVRAIKDEHMKTHTDQRTLTNGDSALCPHCGKFLTSARNLQSHVRNVHSATKNYDDIVHKCKHCGRIFRQKCNLSLHEKMVHAEPNIMCDQCPRMFRHRQYLRKHIETKHADKNENRYACEKCGVLFGSVARLRLHISNVHEGIKRYECDLCGERFGRTDYLRRHKKYHERYMQNVCGICRMSFRTSWYLQLHMDGGHDENGRSLFKHRRAQRIGCTNIPKRSSQEYRMSAKSLKPKACPICQKVLSNTSSLRNHYKGHLRLLQKKCPKCDIYFGSDSTLSKHIKRHDDPRYNLRCQICRALHNTKEDLEQHLEQKHKDNMRHKCHICMEGFGRKYLLANHIHATHPEEQERREQLFSILNNTEAQEVPLETYNQLKFTRKSIFRESDVDTVTKKLIVEKIEPDYVEEDHFSKDEEEWEQDEPKEESEPSEDEEEEFSLFDQDYDITEEACRQLKELENASSWGRCKRSDPAFSECIRKNLQLAITSMKKPIPELSLSSFDPLEIPELYIGAGRGPVNVAQHFKNVKLHGLTNVKVFKSVLNFETRQLISDSLNPELRLEGDYNMNGRVLLLPVVGNGRCNVTLLNMKIRHVMDFDYVERRGKTFMKITDFKVTMVPERVEFKFDNLFNGQKELGENINNVLNESSKEVFEDVRPGYEKSFGLIFMDLANRVLNKLPVNDIFLD